MRYFIYTLLLTLLALSSACSRGPDEALLNTEIQQRLDQQFANDLFRTVTIVRKGTAPRLDGVDGIFVYYNLKLEFLRKYNLNSWQGLNVGTLAAVLGAATTSIEGINSAGNQKGDHLFIRGRLGYQQIDDEWVASTFTPVTLDDTKSITETLDTHSPDAVIDGIRQLLKNKSDTGRSNKDRVTVNELQRALARIDLGHATLNGFHTFGTGWPSGSYYKFGKAYAEYAKKHHFKIYNYASEGSLENGYRLNTGRIDFALLQSDVAEVLYKGWSEEGQPPSPNLRAIASLWPEAIHIITLKNSGIKKLSDIPGKKIAIGSLQSGTRFTAARIWQAAGFTQLNSKNTRMSGINDSIKDLENGEVDVIIIAGAIPDPAVQNLAQRRQDIRFVGLEHSLISKLIEQNFTYYGLPIPAKTYPGQSEPVVTLGMSALLTTSIHTADDVVTQYLQLMVEGSKEIAQAFYRAGFISYKTVRLGISMPLHPAAKKFYADFSQEKLPSTDSDNNLSTEPAKIDADEN